MHYNYNGTKTIYGVKPLEDAVHFYLIIFEVENTSSLDIGYLYFVVSSHMTNHLRSGLGEVVTQCFPPPPTTSLTLQQISEFKMSLKECWEGWGILYSSIYSNFS